MNRNVTDENLPVIVEPVPVGGVGTGVGRRRRVAAAALVAAEVHPSRVEVLVLLGVILQLGGVPPTLSDAAREPREGGPPVRQRPVADHGGGQGAVATLKGTIFSTFTFWAIMKIANSGLSVLTPQLEGQISGCTFTFSNKLIQNESLSCN